jgi:hypothetical protein
MGTGAKVIGCMVLVCVGLVVGLLAIGGLGYVFVEGKRSAETASPTAAASTATPTPDARFPVGAETNLNGCENRTGALVVPSVRLWAEAGDIATPGQRIVAERPGTSKAARCRGARVRIVETRVASQGVTFVRVTAAGAEGWVTERLIHPVK